ncbi:multidrug transporter [Dyella jiangningensis]|uniref:Multidrug transporter n=1 Tax=Dyella jiangningensis TaxID=1379159 RepID=A0A328P5B2_9GAMM|nr:multidrug transporter [Dyella jiangningensis]RAO75785.1 multidrug transporter [Dyella jiangningensis]
MTSKKGPPNYRDAGTGQFVTEGYAKKHPGTTEKEHNKPAPKPPSKPKK